MTQLDRKRRTEIEAMFGNGRGLKILSELLLGADAKDRTGSPIVDVLLLQLFGGVDKVTPGAMRQRGDIDILLFDPSPDTLVLANRIWGLAPTSHLTDLNLIASDDVQRSIEKSESEMQDGVLVLDNLPMGSCRGHQVNYFLEDVQYGGHPSFDRRTTYPPVLKLDREPGRS